jgi:hypothetical protein
MKGGDVPDNMVVHHKKPIFRGGTNNPMENPNSFRKLTKGFSNFVEALEEKGEDDVV